MGGTLGGKLEDGRGEGGGRVGNREGGMKGEMKGAIGDGGNRIGGEGKRGRGHKQIKVI